MHRCRSNRRLADLFGAVHVLRRTTRVSTTPYCLDKRLEPLPRVQRKDVVSRSQLQGAISERVIYQGVIVLVVIGVVEQDFEDRRTEKLASIPQVDFVLRNADAVENPRQLGIPHFWLVAGRSSHADGGTRRNVVNPPAQFSVKATASEGIRSRQVDGSGLGRGDARTLRNRHRRMSNERRVDGLSEKKT